MAPVRELVTQTRAPVRKANSWRFGVGQAVQPVSEQMIPPPPRTRVQPTVRKPAVLCASCRAPMKNLIAGQDTRCPSCNRHVHVPSRIRLECDRCRQTAYARPWELGAARLCAKCGKPLVIDEILLSPRRRRRHTHHHHSHGTAAAPHADAAWGVLIVGLTLITVVAALTVL